MRVVTILGPSQSGKTTLTEALAGLEGHKPHRLALFGDAAVTRASFMGDDWAFLDCPGGGENLSLAAPMLAGSDAAVIVVPADVDAAVLAAPWLRLTEEAGLPTFVFINKLDMASARTSAIVAALQAYCPHAIVLRQIPIREGGQIVGAVDLISERAWEYHEGARSSLVELPASLKAREQEARAELLEHLADFDDVLLSELIEDQKPMTDELYDVSTRVLQHHDLIPALMGAASHGNGVMRLMKSLRHEVPEIATTRARVAPEGGLRAVGLMADSVKHLGKTVLIRAFDDGLGAGAQLGGGSVGSINDTDGKTPLATLAAGAIGLTVKTDHLQTRAPLYGAEGVPPSPDWLAPRAPRLRVRIAPANERDDARLSTALTRLVEIDPGLSIAQDAQSGQSILETQGALHQRRVIDKLAEVFGIEVAIEPVPAALCETISKGCEKHYRHRKQSGGAGQFADVVLTVAPRERGTGFVFTETVKGGAVPRNYIPAVEAGVREALTAGPQGFPVVDLEVTLTDGKSHSVDSSDFAFRTAGKSALREALTELRTQVLQPVNRVEIHVPSIYAGSLVPLVTGLKGQVLGFESDISAKGWDAFSALLPATAEAELAQALGGATRGTAWFESGFDHYEELHGDVKTLVTA